MWLPFKIYMALVVASLGYLMVFRLPAKFINGYFAYTLSGRLFMRYNPKLYRCKSYFEHQKAILRSFGAIPKYRRFSMVTNQVFCDHFKRAERRGMLKILDCKKLRRTINVTPLERRLGRPIKFNGKVQAYKVWFVMR